MTFRCLTSREMDERRERKLAERHYWRGFFSAILTVAGILAIVAVVIIATLSPIN